MRRLLVIVGATVVLVGLLWWAALGFGADSVWFAFLVVWLPMTWLGTISRVAVPHLPERYYVLRRRELDGRLYERLGVRVVKRLLRRGPLAVFNPGLHLPAEPTAAGLTRLEQRMRDAESTHAVLFVLTLAVVGHAAARGWWSAAAWTLLFDVLVNGYPVMLQRYNRALLHRRFAGVDPPRPT